MVISIMLVMFLVVLVVLIIVLVLVMYLFKKGVKLWESVVLKFLDVGYCKGLLWVILYKKVVIGIVVIMVVVVGVVFFWFGIEFVLELEEGIINLCVILVFLFSLDIVLEVFFKFENILMGFLEVIYILLCIGCVEIGGDFEFVNNIEIYIGLKLVFEWISVSNCYEL